MFSVNIQRFLSAWLFKFIYVELDILLPCFHVCLVLYKFSFSESLTILAFFCTLTLAQEDCISFLSTTGQKLFLGHQLEILLCCLQIYDGQQQEKLVMHNQILLTVVWYPSTFIFCLSLYLGASKLIGKHWFTHRQYGPKSKLHLNIY